MNGTQSPPIWVEEYGKEILYTKYCLLSQSQIIEQFKHTINLARAKGGHLLVLSDFKDAPLTDAVVDELKVLSAEAIKETKVKSAVLGITGIKRFLLTVYSQFSKDFPVSFSSYQEAVDYLVENQ
jgi:hypothetical protein